MPGDVLRAVEQPLGTSLRTRPRGREGGEGGSGVRRRGRGHATAVEVVAPVDVTARGRPRCRCGRGRGGGWEEQGLPPRTGHGAVAEDVASMNVAAWGGRRGCRCERGPRGGGGAGAVAADKATGQLRRTLPPRTQQVDAVAQTLIGERMSLITRPGWD